MVDLVESVGVEALSRVQPATVHIIENMQDAAGKFGLAPPELTIATALALAAIMKAHEIVNPGTANRDLVVAMLSTPGLFDQFQAGAAA